MLESLLETSTNEIKHVVTGVTPQMPKTLYTARGKIDKKIITKFKRDHHQTLDIKGTTSPLFQ